MPKINKAKVSEAIKRLGFFEKSLQDAINALRTQLQLAESRADKAPAVAERLLKEAQEDLDHLKRTVALAPKNLANLANYIDSLSNEDAFSGLGS